MCVCVCVGVMRSLSMCPYLIFFYFRVRLLMEKPLLRVDFWERFMDLSGNVM